MRIFYLAFFTRTDHHASHHELHQLLHEGDFSALRETDNMTMSSARTHPTGTLNTTIDSRTLPYDGDMLLHEHALRSESHQGHFDDYCEPSITTATSTFERRMYVTRYQQYDRPLHEFSGVTARML